MGKAFARRLKVFGSLKVLAYDNTDWFCANKFISKEVSSWEKKINSKADFSRVHFLSLLKPETFS